MWRCCLMFFGVVATALAARDPWQPAEGFTGNGFLRHLSQLQLPNGVDGLDGPSPLTTMYAAVPDASRGPPIQPELGYRVEDLGAGAYLVTDALQQLMVVTAGEMVVLVNAPESAGLIGNISDPPTESKLPAIIRTITPNPVTHIVYAQSNINHIGAAGPIVAAFRDEADIQIIGHEETLQAIRTRNAFSVGMGLGPRTPEPTSTFTGNTTLTDAEGNTVLELWSMGFNQDEGMIYVIHPATGTLYLSGIVWPGWAPFDRMGVSTDLLSFMTAQQTVLDLFDSGEITQVVGAHTNLKASRRDVEVQLEYVMDVLNASMAILDPNNPDTMRIGPIAFALGIFDPSHPHFGNTWLLYKTYIDQAAQLCAEMVLERSGVAGQPIGIGWTDVLAGADVNTEDNCWGMIVAVRTNIFGFTLQDIYATP